MEFGNLKYLVVGSGFFGATIAERIANDMHEQVVVVEKRNHIGGNSFSFIDGETGIECHKYGTHVFHTSNRKVWDYANSFSVFKSYQHKVLSQYKNKVYQMPININTIDSFYGMNMKPVEAERFIKSEALKEGIVNASNLEEKAISLIGRPLYEAFIKDYSLKQWGTDPKILPASIITRLPLRYNYNSNYFDDLWQGLPMQGYSSIFEKMLSNKNITVFLNTDYFDIKHLIPNNCCVVYTGPVDRFFEYKYGRLGWRTLYFEKEVVEVDDYQGTPVVNYAEKIFPYTRIHEFKHLHMERKCASQKTIIFREYPIINKLEVDPYYPINSLADTQILTKYSNDCGRERNVIFGGRLATYKYFDMDEVIESALAIYENIKSKRR